MATGGQTPQPRGYFGDLLVWNLWAVVVAMSSIVAFSPPAWWSRQDGASAGTLILAWLAYAAALAVAVASFMIAFGPVRRARSDGRLLGWVVACIATLVLAVGLAIVPTVLLPAA